jgi:hypothetical protein
MDHPVASDGKLILPRIIRVFPLEDSNEFFDLKDRAGHLLKARCVADTAKAINNGHFLSININPNQPSESGLSVTITERFIIFFPRVIPPEEGLFAEEAQQAQYETEFESFRVPPEEGASP